MYKCLRWCFLAAVVLAGAQAFAQPYQPLSVGDTVKGSAWELIRVGGKQLYILDFWSTWCTSCIKSFPKMEQLQKEFSKDLEVLLVNSYETAEDIDKRLSKLNQFYDKNGLKQAAIPPLRRMDGDTLLKKLFPHVGVPHHVWLNGNGKVLAITHGENATAAHVKAALDGQALSMAVKRDLKAEGYDAWEVGLFQSGHPALKPAFFTGFIHYTPGMGSGNAEKTDTLNQTYRRSWINTTIPSLYWSAAFQLPTKPRFLVELKDRQRFEEPDSGGVHDAWNDEYLYSYEMLLPVEDKALIGKIFLHDLNRFFGKKMGVEGVVEKRKMPVYILVARQPEKITTKGGLRASSRKDNQYSWVNTPLNRIATTLRARLENIEQGIVFLNEVNAESQRPVDMELVVDGKDMQGLKKQLRKYGLDLLLEEREIEVLVLRYKNGLISNIDLLR